MSTMRQLAMHLALQMVCHMFALVGDFEERLTWTVSEAFRFWFDWVFELWEARLTMLVLESMFV